MPLFRSIPADALAATVKCLSTCVVRVQDKGVLIRPGDRSSTFGVILSGGANILRYASDGQVELVTNLSVGDVVGASYVLAGVSEYPIAAVAVGTTEVLLLDGAHLLAPCKTRCAAHCELLSRLLVMLARGNVRFSEKIECLSRRRTADRLMTYLHRQAQLAGSDSFEIPFTRQQLADYLNVERTALCSEIGKLVATGRLETDRKLFRIRFPSTAGKKGHDK